MSKKHAYVERTEAQMERWHREIDELAGRVESKNDSVRMGVLHQIEGLRLKETEVRVKLERLKMAADEIWAGAKVGVERAATELEDALHKAWEKIG